MATGASALLYSGKTVKGAGTIDLDAESGTISLPTRTAATENEICITSGNKLQYRDGATNYTVANESTTSDFTWGHTSFLGRILRDADTGTFAYADADISESTDTNGVNTGYLCNDGGTYRVAFQISVPTELDVTQACDAYIVHRPGSGAGNGTIELEIAAMAHASGEAPGTGGYAFTGAVTITGHTTATLIVSKISSIFGASTLAVRDAIRGCVFRDASAGNADDTSTNTVYLEEVYFVGKRKVVP